MSLFSYPAFDYPTLTKGYIRGPIRCLSLDGSELWISEMPGTLRITPFTHNINNLSLKRLRDGAWAPAIPDGKIYAVTHVQKLAYSFSLWFNPLSYHIGRYWKLQEYSQNPDGGWDWKPGTEKGVYARSPGWRWQMPDSRSGGKPWIWSNGRFFGGHLD